MNSRGENVHRTAVGVVAGIADKLVVQGKSRRRRQRIAVVSLKNFLQTIVGQLPVADENAETSGIQKRDMDAGDAVDDAGDADGIVRPAPRLAGQRNAA